MEKFSITASIRIEPAATRKEIEEAFQLHYGDRGTDETPAEHVLRKIEEHVLQVYRDRASQVTAQAALAAHREQINTAATIRLKKDQPEGAVSKLMNRLKGK